MERRGGRFAGWRCLVVLGDAKMRDIYGRVLAAGGADVRQWKSVQSLGEEFMPNKVKDPHKVSITNILAVTLQGGASVREVG